MRWLMSVLPQAGRLTQKAHHKYMASLGYTVSSRPTGTSEWAWPIRHYVTEQCSLQMLLWLERRMSLEARALNACPSWHYSGQLWKLEEVGSDWQKQMWHQPWLLPPCLLVCCMLRHHEPTWQTESSETVGQTNLPILNVCLQLVTAAGDSHTNTTNRWANMVPTFGGGCFFSSVRL